ncbi:MAG TPA: hypothetical protein VJV05_01840 [Pyrinomonadaceae bacterium]|nr:hypothetical protein [Pyrinomonadaceae bacterium]
MKKLYFLAAAVLLLSVSAFAQDKPTKDYSGVWTLDVSKSKLDERARIESMTMTVAQIGKDLKVTTETKRMAPPADAAGGPGGGGGRGGGRGFGGGDGTNTYSLDGKETTTTRETQMGSIPVKHTAMLDQGRVRISSSSSFSGPNGEVTMTTKEVWSMSDDGKTLTVERESTSPRGTSASTMVFTKK